MNAVLIDWDRSPATLNFLSDITNLKLAEEALEQSSQKWEAVISASPDGIGLISLDGKIQLISDKLVLMHGYSNDQMIDIVGRSIFDFIDPSDHKLLLENTRKLIDGQKSTELTEYKALKKDNSWFYIDVNASILHDSNGKPTSILYVERDITERKLAEAAIKKSNQELEKLNSEKNKLFSIIAHDMRSSFNNLIGFTEALATDSQNMSSAAITKYSGSLHRSVLALYTLLENLLEWALLQKGSIMFAPKYLRLSDIFSNSHGTIAERALQKEIAILNEIPGDQEIYADEKMITSVLRNILSNAVKFTRRGGEVVVKAKEIEGEYVEISITDTGIGIPDNNIGKLFRLDVKIGSNGTDNEPSTGLGLVLCREFVEKHGGKIWVESRENKGSTFYITLPTKNKISNVA
jgi:PAS domain S-box-containing protein